MVKFKQPHHYMRIKYSDVNIFDVYDHLKRDIKIGDFIIGVDDESNLIGEIFTPKRTMITAAYPGFLKFIDSTGVLVRGKIMEGEDEEFSEDKIKEDIGYLVSGDRYKKSTHERQRPGSSQVSRPHNISQEHGENDVLKDVKSMEFEISEKDALIEKFKKELEKKEAKVDVYKREMERIMKELNNRNLEIQRLKEELEAKNNKIISQDQYNEIEGVIELKTALTTMQKDQEESEEVIKNLRSVIEFYKNKQGNGSGSFF